MNSNKAHGLTCNVWYRGRMLWSKMINDSVIEHKRIKI